MMFWSPVRNCEASGCVRPSTLSGRSPPTTSRCSCRTFSLVTRSMGHGSEIWMPGKTRGSITLSEARDHRLLIGGHNVDSAEQPEGAGGQRQALTP